MTEPRVLVVDDEEGPREAIRMILKPRYQVFTAGSGEEVLAVLPGAPPGRDLHGREDAADGRRPAPRARQGDRCQRGGRDDHGLRVARHRPAGDAIRRDGLPGEAVRAAGAPGSRGAGARPAAAALGGAGGRAGAADRHRCAISRSAGIPSQGGDLAALLRAMLHEAQRVTGAAAASFLGTEPAAIVHSELPAAVGDAVAAAWRTALPGVREPVGIRPGLDRPLPWPAELDALGFEAADGGAGGGRGAPARAGPPRALPSPGAGARAARTSPPSGP